MAAVAVRERNLTSNMSGDHVNYDRLAPVYHQRYTLNALTGVAASLMALARDGDAQRILEVGCGTGRWLAELWPVAHRVYGLDLSPGMLRQARQQDARFHLTCGRATRLPFPEAAFDLVFCVNALHHFDSPRVFISEARRLLRPGGALAVVGMDPHTGRDDWYLYHYFEGTLAADLGRFPSAGTILDWMIASGFDQVERRVAEHITRHFVGREVLGDYFLQKHSTSQLVLLTDEAYAAGVRRIEAALATAEAEGKTLVFPNDLFLAILVGRTPVIE